MPREFLRFIPKDARTTVANGWCYSQSGQPPSGCSWCGKEFAVKGEGLWCVLCDEPAVKKEVSDA